MNLSNQQSSSAIFSLSRLALYTIIIGAVTLFFLYFLWQPYLRSLITFSQDGALQVLSSLGQVFFAYLMALVSAYWAAEEHARRRSAHHREYMTGQPDFSSGLNAETQDRLNKKQASEALKNVGESFDASLFIDFSKIIGEFGTENVDEKVARQRWALCDQIIGQLQKLKIFDTKGTCERSLVAVVDLQRLYLFIWHSNAEKTLNEQLAKVRPFSQLGFSFALVQSIVCFTSAPLFVHSIPYFKITVLSQDIPGGIIVLYTTVSLFVATLLAFRLTQGFALIFSLPGDPV
jgi:hypothetical protein